MTDSSLLEFLGTIIRGVSSERSSFIAEAPSTSYFWINHSIPPTLSTSLMASSVWGVASSMKYAVICRWKNAWICQFLQNPKFSFKLTHHKNVPLTDIHLWNSTGSWYPIMLTFIIFCFKKHKERKIDLALSSSLWSAFSPLKQRRMIVFFCIGIDRRHTI